jgi:anti-sigma-K factor RskA
VTNPGDPLHDTVGAHADGGGVWTPHDALSAYALGALDVDDQRLFELHLFVCEACRSEVAAYRRTGELLPYGLTPTQPPDGARDRLLARARAEASESPTVAVPAISDDESPTVIVAAPTLVHSAPTVAQAAPNLDRAAQTVVQAIPVEEPAEAGPATVPVRRAEPRRGFRIGLASIGWSVVLLLVLASGLGVGYWSSTGPHVSPEVQLMARLPGGQILPLRGTTVPSASARLFVIENGRRAELSVDALPPLSPGRVYQIWFSESDRPPRTGGAFGVNQHGDAAVRVTIPTPLERVSAISVTQEPAPGLASPTGVNLIDWKP